MLNKNKKVAYGVILTGLIAAFLLTSEHSALREMLVAQEAYYRGEYTVTTYYPAPFGRYQEIETRGNTYLATEGGAVGIGTTTPSYLLAMESSGGGYYDTTDHQWHNGSSMQLKTDIKPNDMDVLKMLTDINIMNYRYKTELKNDKNAPYHIGFIAEETPKLLSGKDQNSMALGIASDCCLPL